MIRPLPLFAVLLGLAGLLPFIACSIGALSLEADAAQRSLFALVAYGATILAFLGGVHWGFALDDSGSPSVLVQRARYGLGVLPSLVGWLALLVMFLGLPMAGLLILIAGVIVLTLVEGRAARRLLVPRGYMRLRWVLSAGVLGCLVTVCVVRALGGRIVL